MKLADWEDLMPSPVLQTLSPHDASSCGAPRDVVELNKKADLAEQTITVRKNDHVYATSSIHIAHGVFKVRPAKWAA